MELNAYIRLIRRWLWLIVLASVVAASASFVVARTQPAQYQASTTIQVGAYLNLANPSSGMFQTAEQLAQTYSAMIKTYPVLTAVVDKLQLPFSADSLSGLFQTRLVSGTSLMTIVVTYTDPIVASDIANELAVELIASSPTNLTKEQKEQLTILQAEIKQAQAQLQDARDEIKAIEQSFGSQTAQNQAILTARKAELINQINTTQSNLAQMSTTAATLQQEGNVNSLRVVEPSRIPESPIGASPVSRMLIAALVGAVLAIGAAFLIEYLNNSIRSPSEIVPLLNVPLLGAIAPFGRKGSYKDKLITWTQPRASISEAYRALRVNILFREEGDETQPDCRMYVVTSAGPSEGKSLTVSNLAVTFAITGMRVLIVDADLRRPAMNQVFNLPNSIGLTTLWKDGYTERTMLSSSRANSEQRASKSETLLSQIVQKTEVPGLDVITSGPSPANPAELLDTVQMRDLIQQIMTSRRYDVVFFDTPPALVVTDSSIVANLTKSKVILVVEAGRTHRASAVRMIQQLTTLSIDVMGVVINRLSPRDMDAGYGQYYYGYSRYADSETSPVSTN